MFFQKEITKGMTLIEVIVSLAIIVLLISVSVPFISSYKNNVSLTKKVNETLAMLIDARSLAITNNNNSCYGIKILSDKIVLFSAGINCTDNYNVSATTNKILLLDSVVADNLSLPDSSGSQITFKKNTGEIYGTSGSFRLHLINDLNKTITFSINQAGVINKQ